MGKKTYKVLVRMRDQSEHEVTIQAPNETVAKAYAREYMLNPAMDEESLVCVEDEIEDEEEYLGASLDLILLDIRSCRVIDDITTYSPYDPMAPDAEVIDIKEVK